MKSMKTMLVAALVAGSLLAGGTAVFAQANGGAPGAPGARGARGPMNADTMVTRLQTALGETNKLSDAQIPKVKAVFDDQIKKQTDLRNDTTIARAETSDALKAILTPAQFTIYEALPQGGRGGRGGAGGGAPAPAN
jgi:Spy/CpxP family protein refolding chaperone